MSVNMVTVVFLVGFCIAALVAFFFRYSYKTKVLNKSSKVMIFGFFSALFCGYIMPAVVLLMFYCPFVYWLVSDIFGISQSIATNMFFELMTSCIAYGGVYLVGCFKLFDEVIEQYKNA